MKFLRINHLSLEALRKIEEIAVQETSDMKKMSNSTYTSQPWASVFATWSDQLSDQFKKVHTVVLDKQSDRPASFKTINIERFSVEALRVIQQAYLSDIYAVRAASKASGEGMYELKDWLNEEFERIQRFLDGDLR